MCHAVHTMCSGAVNRSAVQSALAHSRQRSASASARGNALDPCRIDAPATFATPATNTPFVANVAGVAMSQLPFPGSLTRKNRNRIAARCDSWPSQRPSQRALSDDPRAENCGIAKIAGGRMSVATAFFVTLPVSKMSVLDGDLGLVMVAPHL